MSDDVISIALITGEDIEPALLTVLTVYQDGDKYVLGDGKKQIENAVIESIKQLGGTSASFLYLKVEILPMPEKRRRTRGGEV